MLMCRVTFSGDAIEVCAFGVRGSFNAPNQARVVRTCADDS
jgi:hypothetical protein